MIDKNRISRIVVEQGDSKMIWETPYNDASVEDMIQGFVGCLVGLSWNENVVLESIYSYAKDVLGVVDNGDIVDIEAEPVE